MLCSVHEMPGSATLDLGVVNTAPTQPPFAVAVNEPSGKRQSSPRTQSPVEADVVSPEPIMEQTDALYGYALKTYWEGRNLEPTSKATYISKTL